MVFYRYIGNDDLWLGKYGKSEKTLIPNEILTQSELNSIKSKCPRLNIDRTFKAIDIPKSKTYSMFGVRFEDGTDHNSKLESKRMNVKKLHIKESAQYNVLPDRYVKAVKKAVDIINKWIEDESEYLPDLLSRGYNTYNFVSEYIKDDWTLDVDMILNDWDESEEEFQADYGAHSLSGSWDPRDYLFNILRELLGYSYEDAEKLLAYK